MDAVDQDATMLADLVVLVEASEVGQEEALAASVAVVPQVAERVEDFNFFQQKSIMHRSNYLYNGMRRSDGVEKGDVLFSLRLPVM